MQFSFHNFLDAVSNMKGFCTKIHVAQCAAECSVRLSAALMLHKKQPHPVGDEVGITDCYVVQHRIVTPSRL